MISKYGDFSAEQLNEYRERLHSKMFWLLLYKDPKTSDQFETVNFDRYFENLMKELNGLGDLLLHPNGLVEMMSELEAAYNESMHEEFSYPIYRKFVLDAHNILDTMNWEETADDYNR